MTTNTFINTTSLDMAAYKQSFKEYLKTQTQFKDYDFEGSNMSVLLDILAYNTYHNSLYLNMIGSEMFLDTAQMRESIVSHAKELNYVPRSKSSARISLTITVPNPIGSPETLIIPKYFKVIGKDIQDNSSFYFMTDSPVVLSKADNYTAVVDFYEGVVRSEAFLASPTKRYVLQSKRIDNQSIVVNVQNSQSDKITNEWVRANSVFGLTADDRVYFIQGAEDYKFELVFGNDLVGKAISPGNIVLVKYRETSGDLANGISTYSAADSVDGNVPTVSLAISGSKSQGGSAEETTESIRFNSTKFFQTQERAITSNDFIALILNKYTFLKTAIAYGGEEIFPPQFGTVLISAIPNAGEFISSSAKRDIEEYVKQRTTLSIDAKFVDPEYIYLEIYSDVKYNPSRATVSTATIASEVTSSILDYSEEFLSSFGADLRYSKLVRTIDESDPAIVSNDTNIIMYRELEPSPNEPFAFSFSFENQISNNKTNSTVYSSPFIYNNLEARIEDDLAGRLQIKYINGEFDNVNIGTVNYETGSLSISSIIINSYESTIKLYAEPENKDLEYKTNKALLVRPENIFINVVSTRS